MLNIWIYSLVSVFAVSAISLIGAFTLSLNRQKLEKILIFFVSFSAGALIGDSFIHLIPEVFEKSNGVFSSLLIIFGIILFFILEKYIRWRHCHKIENNSHHHPVVAMNLIGDGLHNFIDGVVIGASYLVSIPVGVATTIAVILHEIPQEIGDFGVLLNGGLSIKKVLGFNFLSGIIAVIGTVLTLLVGSKIENISSFVIPVVIGGFLYIAGSDLIPELHRDCEARSKSSIFQVVFMVLGVALMALLLLIE